RLWLATRTAQAAGEGQARHEPGQAPLWGLGRVIALEHPEIWGGLIDLDDIGADVCARQLLAEVWEPDRDGEDQVAWRGDQRYVARLVPSAPPVWRATSWRADGSYLITGGLGGLGLKLARWLAEQGVRHMVLTSRSGLQSREVGAGLPPESEAARRVSAVQKIEALGATVVTAAVDVRDRAGMGTLITQFGATMPPLRGVFHAAASVTYRPLAELSPDELDDAMEGKAAGAWTLHQLTKHMDLDCFVLFSSTTALLGVSQMAHYAAANCALDSLAHLRRGLGLPALSVNWGVWEEMRGFSAEERQAAVRYGLRPIPVQAALAALGALAQGGPAQKTVADADWSLLRATYETRRRRPLLADLQAEARVAAPRPAAREESLRERLERALPSERRDMLLDFVAGAAASVLGYEDAGRLNVRQGLFEMGMDSLMAVELRARLEAGAGQALPSTLTFNYPTVDALAGYLETEAFGFGAHAEAPPPHKAPAEEAPLEGLSEGDLLRLLDAELAAADTWEKGN
ncbi:MAG: SDR family NAD(P)-dependent oxidoreductase, partial [Chloroflexales bacterium]|nr:SDR family NAD(P)-dependent oxidoreductase [Chloroflexales bacterium]